MYIFAKSYRRVRLSDGKHKNGLKILRYRGFSPLHFAGTQFTDVAKVVNAVRLERMKVQVRVLLSVRIAQMTKAIATP